MTYVLDLLLLNCSVQSSRNRFSSCTPVTQKKNELRFYSSSPRFEPRPAACQANALTIRLSCSDRDELSMKLRLIQYHFQASVQSSRLKDSVFWFPVILNFFVIVLEIYSLGGKISATTNLWPNW